MQSHPIWTYKPNKPAQPAPGNIKPPNHSKNNCKVPCTTNENHKKKRDSTVVLRVV